MLSTAKFTCIYSVKDNELLLWALVETFWQQKTEERVETY